MQATQAVLPRPQIQARERGQRRRPPSKLLLRAINPEAIPQPPYRPLWENRCGRILGPLWIFYSSKAHRIVRLRGNIVYYAWLLLEADPEVAELCEQPFAVRIKVEGRWISGAVDIWVRMRDRRQLFVVAIYRNHVTGSLPSPITKRRLRALTVWAERSGAALAVMPNTTIWRDPQFLSNWAYILRFLSEQHRVIDLELGEFVVRAVNARRCLTLSEIEATFPDLDPAALRAAVFRQLYVGALRADLREHRIGAHTKFTLP